MAGVVHRHHHFARRGYRQRMYVERTKPLEQYTTEELYARFRFGKADIEYLVSLLRPKLQHRTQRSHGLSVEDQILIDLGFYACGTFYQVVGDYMGVAKSAVCDVVKDVSIALANLVNEFVSFPKDNQIAQAKRSFFILGNMPNTIGAIDCTHVEPQKACNITLACIVLHNIATKRNVLSVLTVMHLSPLETLTNILHSARMSKQDVQQGTQ
ncbi:hypothetical protein ABVT39_028106 [Epinephelus coioides]